MKLLSKQEISQLAEIWNESFRHHRISVRFADLTDFERSHITDPAVHLLNPTDVCFNQVLQLAFHSMISTIVIYK